MKNIKLFKIIYKYIYIMEPEKPKNEFIIYKKNKAQLINHNKYIYIFYTKGASWDTTYR